MCMVYVRAGVYLDVRAVVLVIHHMCPALASKSHWLPTCSIPTPWDALPWDYNEMLYPWDVLPSLMCETLHDGVWCPTGVWVWCSTSKRSEDIHNPQMAPSGARNCRCRNCSTPPCRTRRWPWLLSSERSATLNTAQRLVLFVYMLCCSESLHLKNIIDLLTYINAAVYVDYVSWHDDPMQPTTQTFPLYRSKSNDHDDSLSR